MNKWVYLGISAVSDFIITAGTALMALNPTTGLPSTWQLSVCIAGGLVQAARGVQKSLSAPPQ